MKFAVKGIKPAPQGSKKLTRYGAMIEACPRHKIWRKAVAKAAEATGFPMTDRPVFVQITFLFERRKSDLDSNGRPKANAPLYKSTAPDLDKLVRSTLDAITGILIKNDSQVVNLICCKQYANEGELPGALINVNPL